MDANYLALEKNEEKESSTAGFEPAQAMPNRFRVCLLNHSDISTSGKGTGGDIVVTAAVGTFSSEGGRNGRNEAAATASKMFGSNGNSNDSSEDNKGRVDEGDCSFKGRRFWHS
ncbi:hypothetical protein PVK06_022298 [Gossypium arboreum]|uniref:Uncharacterized protein n=1 Tax=Gossypium arboreum TaxID=29729 RepID=A0ABR0P833_GOSAR|nr:hypothetical protein PVK06_022298 [Gossypium arboreum]